MVEGTKLLAEALNSDKGVESVFCAPGTSNKVLDEAQARGVRIFELESGVIERVADAVTPQPVMAIVPYLDTTLEKVIEAELVVVLVDVRDPGNAGTILRSAEASGNVAVILCDGSVDLYNPKTVRSSAGSLFHVPISLREEPNLVFDELSRRGFRTVGTAMEGGHLYDEVDLTRQLALVFGNEANGLPASVIAALDETVSIPIEGRSESLNVSMAASVLLFEASRQRRVMSR